MACSEAICPVQGRHNESRQSHQRMVRADRIGAEPIGERPGKHSTMICGVAAPPRHDGPTFPRTPSATAETLQVPGGGSSAFGIVQRSQKGVSV